MSELGRDLFDISRDYAETGGELLNEEEIEIEIARRRGSYVEEGGTKKAHDQTSYLIPR